MTNLFHPLYFSKAFAQSSPTTAIRTRIPGQWLAGLTWVARLSVPSSLFPMCHRTKPPSTDRQAEPDPLLARAEMSPSSSNNLCKVYVYLLASWMDLFLLLGNVLLVPIGALYTNQQVAFLSAQCHHFTTVALDCYCSVHIMESILKYLIQQTNAKCRRTSKKNVIIHLCINML